MCEKETQIKPGNQVRKVYEKKWKPKKRADLDWAISVKKNKKPSSHVKIVCDQKKKQKKNLLVVFKWTAITVQNNNNKKVSIGRKVAVETKIK